VANVTFVFGTSPNTKPEEKKRGDIAYYVPRVPHQIALMAVTNTKLRHESFLAEHFSKYIF